MLGMMEGQIKLELERVKMDIRMRPKISNQELDDIIFKGVAGAIARNNSAIERDIEKRLKKSLDRHTNSQCYLHPVVLLNQSDYLPLNRA